MTHGEQFSNSFFSDSSIHRIIHFYCNRANFFATRNRLKLKSGNLFSAQDVADNNQVALIDESAKKSIFPDENPIGKIVMFNKRPLRIIMSYSAWHFVHSFVGLRQWHH